MNGLNEKTPESHESQSEGNARRHENETTTATQPATRVILNTTSETVSTTGDFKLAA